MGKAEPENEVDFTAPCVLGIDEAGRGPVLGPMVYAAAYCPRSKLDSLHALGADDSKQLSEEQRNGLRKKILDAPFLRTIVTPLSAETLSNMMLRRHKYNLNLISHDAALDLVQTALDSGANITEVYVDTVGPPEKYAAKFRERFPGLAKVDVRKKADSLFRIVGAASIVAKTHRDAVIHGWEFEEKGLHLSHNTGSGYPADPLTKKWMADSVDNVFGFPSFVRFSWGTTRTLLEKNAVEVEWESDEEDETVPGTEPVRKTRDITSFFGKKSGSGGSASGRAKTLEKRSIIHPAKLPPCLTQMGIQRGRHLL